MQLPNTSPVQDLEKRQQQLGVIAQGMPRQTSATLQGMENARVLQMQNMFGQTSNPNQNPLTNTQIAQQGSVQQGQAQTARVQATQQNAKGLGQLGQMELQNQKALAQERNFGRQQQLEKQQQQNLAKVASLNSQVKRDLFEKNMEFKKDELGRTQFNDRQLADYALLKARTEEDYANYEQEVGQASEMKMQILKQSYHVITQSMKQMFEQEMSTLDNFQREDLARAQANVQQKIKEEQAKARNRSSLWVAGGTVVGAVIGGVVGAVGGAGVGAAPGAAMGASIGGGAGAVVGGMVDS